MTVSRRQFMEIGAAGAVAAVCSSYAGAVAELAGKAERKPVSVAEHVVERRFETTQFGRIAYVEKGTGPAALFLHGFPLNSYQWRDVITKLSPYRRCIAPDSMGLGYTEVAPGQSVSPMAQVKMLGALLDSLSVDSVDLVANDSGGAVAQLFLVSHPERVRTLLLTNCDVETDSPPAAILPLIEQARKGVYPDVGIAPWVADKNLARSATGIGGLAYTYPNMLADETIHYYLAPLVSSAECKNLVNQYVMALTPNPLAGIESKLARCKVPASIVWGTGDDIFSQESPKYLDRVLPNSQGVRRIQGAKLFFPEEFPEIIAEEAKLLWEVGAKARLWL